MMRAVLCLFVARSITAIEYPYAFQSLGDPLVSHVSSADPSAHVWDGKVWVYTSQDGNLFDHGVKEGEDWTYEYMDGYHAFSSEDMVHWVDHGEVFHSRDVPWGTTGWMWAPGAARKDGKYYLYYPHKDGQGEWRVGVAVASAPQGPFEDTGYAIEGAVGIDPMVFIDDDGEAYLYINTAQMAKLKPNMIELAEPMLSIDYASLDVQANSELEFEEGSYMHKMNGKYYYSYSNHVNGDTTAYYAIGDSPYGPFEWKGALRGRSHHSPDHHSIIQFNNEWYYFYHKDTPFGEKEELGWYGHRRIACYEKMYYNPDGTIQIVGPSYFHVNAGGSGYTSSDGTFYNWDMWDKGGGVSVTDSSISDTSDGELYQSERYGIWFTYDVPLANGNYLVTFKFAENYYESVGQRKFHVLMEGDRVIEDLDILFMAGGKNRAYDEAHPVVVSDSELNIEFVAVTENAKISAISIARTDKMPEPALLAPTPPPTPKPTQHPTPEPPPPQTQAPSNIPSMLMTSRPTSTATAAASPLQTNTPSARSPPFTSTMPTLTPTTAATSQPSNAAFARPSSLPSNSTLVAPSSSSSSNSPTAMPSVLPSSSALASPGFAPSSSLSETPNLGTTSPRLLPTRSPQIAVAPSQAPARLPEAPQTGSAEPASTTSQTEDDRDNGSKSRGMIVGLAVSAVAEILAIVAIILYCRRRQLGRKALQSETDTARRDPATQPPV